VRLAPRKADVAGQDATRSGYTRRYLMSRKGAAVALAGALITGALISGMTADPAMRSTVMRSKLRGAARHIPRATAIGEFLLGGRPEYPY